MSLANVVVKNETDSVRKNEDIVIVSRLWITLTQLKHPLLEQLTLCVCVS